MRVTVTPCQQYPWFVEFRFQYSKKAVEDLKRIPGCRWSAEDKCWLVPTEVYSLMQQGKLTIGEHHERTESH